MRTPKATLAATILVAVLSSVDIGALRRTWEYSKMDFAAMAATIVMVLGMGVEIGIVTGVTFHLSEVKGPVMDKLKKMDFLTHLTGNKKGPAETGPFSSIFCRQELSGHQPMLRSQISILIRAKIRGRAPVLPARKSATALSSFLASA